MHDHDGIPCYRIHAQPPPEIYAETDAAVDEWAWSALLDGLELTGEEVEMMRRFVFSVMQEEVDAGRWDDD